jgi:hypothetical protein
MRLWLNGQEILAWEKQPCFDSPACNIWQTLLLKKKKKCVVSTHACEHAVKDIANLKWGFEPTFCGWHGKASMCTCGY